MSAYCDIDISPTEEGWYGIICVAEAGDGKPDSWGDASHWKPEIGWYDFPKYAMHRSINKFVSRQLALDWARQQ